MVSAATTDVSTAGSGGNGLKPVWAGAMDGAGCVAVLVLRHGASVGEQ